MKSLSHHIALALAFFSTSIGAHADQDPASWLTEEGRKVYQEQYLPGSAPKAFAVSPSGVHGLATKADSLNRAVRAALTDCQKAADDLCVLHAVNDDVLGGSAERQRQAGVALLGAIQRPVQAAYADEDRKTGVAPPAGFHTGKLHAPTPESAPFAKLVSTASLTEMLASAQKPVLIDTLHPNKDSYRRSVIPTALWISGMGLYNEKDNATIDVLTQKVLNGFKVDKTAPIVAYCLSWECWLSYNALYRLSQLGYTNLYWYRGGINAWRKAGLPTLEVPMDAQVW